MDHRWTDKGETAVGLAERLERIASFTSRPDTRMHILEQAAEYHARTMISRLCHGVLATEAVSNGHGTARKADMDINYLFQRQQDERSRAKSAECIEARRAHAALADLYEGAIARLSRGDVRFLAVPERPFR